MKDARTLEQHAGLMRIVTEQLGPLQDYNSVVMPFAPKPDLEQQVLVTVQDESKVSKGVYELMFERQTIPARIYTIDEDGEKKILLFALLWDKLGTDPVLDKKLKALGL